MAFSPEKTIRGMTIIRPGALGDVLVVRGVLCFLRRAFPEAAMTFVAPGERGRLFAREGWADRVFDWDGAEFGWLFSEGENAPGERLRQVFGGSDLVVSYVDSVEGGENRFHRRVEELTPGALRYFSPARLDGDAACPIGSWLLDGLQRFLMDAGAVSADFPDDTADCLRARMEFPVESEEGVLVMHPGSGSRKKNWPLENFAALGQMLVKLTDKEGRAVFSRLVVASGEADADLGRRLCDLVPGAELWPMGGLNELAGLLACARLYVGNDSGVSHLASAVRGVSGQTPKLAVVFGASDARVWSPPDALVLEAGEGMRGLPPSSAFSRIVPFFLR